VAERFKDHFSSRSADYARYRPVYPLALVDHLASLVARQDLALDCGCGTGQLSTRLAARFRRVVATDASARQIENAEPHDAVEYRRAPADRSGVSEGSADLVTAAQAAHWFDLEPFYAEVRRVLRPGGALALITYGNMEIEGPVGEVVRDFQHNVIAGFWPPERCHVETGYRLFPFPFEEVSSPFLAIQASWSLPDLMGYVETWSAVRNAEAALGSTPGDAFAARLGAAWGEPDVRRSVTWPISLRAGYLR